MTEVAVSQTIYTGASEGSGRISIVTEPALPATCAVCVRSANGAVRFIDFNASLDYYGAIVICEECLQESLSLLNFVPVYKLEETILALTQAVEELEVAKSELNKYKSIVTSLRSVGVIGSVNDVESEDATETIETSQRTDGNGLETESDPDGQNSVGGLENLSIFKD